MCLLPLVFDYHPYLFGAAFVALELIGVFFIRRVGAVHEAGTKTKP